VQETGAVAAATVAEVHSGIRCNGTHGVRVVLFGVEAQQVFKTSQQIKTFTGVVVTHPQSQRVTTTI